MATSLETLLAGRDWILADGATGTNLFNMGLASGEAPELWNETEPGKIRALYDGAINAGSDLFLTNSFGGNASRLKLHEADGRAFELNRIAAEIAREAADAAGRPIVVAGSMGPTGEIMAPLGPLTIEDAADIFEEQARGLLAGGADVLWVETISAPDEYAAAAEGIGRTGAPWCGTMSFDTAGRTMMGLTSAGMVELVAGLPNQPLAFGANCGVGASDLLRTVLGFRAAHPALPVISKGNAGIPKFHDGHIHYDGTPELMADYAVLARDCGAKIIGGCCGTTPVHLAAMRAALEETPPGPVPDLDTIAARLGGFSSASDGISGEPPARDRRRRRGWSPPVPATIDATQALLAGSGYIAGRGLATVVFLALKLGRPLFLEGEAGVGKTEIARTLATALGRRLIRLQCYEGLDAASAVYEWNFPAQMVAIRTAEAAGGADRQLLTDELFSERFLIRRPLLEAMEAQEGGAPVLLIDELDRTDEPFEAFLLEALADFQVTIPELGTIKADEPPIVVLTSNRTREVHDALKRRCLYHWVDYPDFERELAILRMRAPEATEALSREVVAFVQRLREEDLFKKPGVAETIDWARCLVALDAVELSPEVIADTLGALLKYQDDIAKLEGSEAKRVLAEARAALDPA